MNKPLCKKFVEHRLKDNAYKVKGNYLESTRVGDTFSYLIINKEEFTAGYVKGYYSVRNTFSAILGLSSDE